MVRRVAALTAAFLAVGTASAQAASLSKLVIKDRGSKIHFYVTLCTAGRVTVDFETDLHTDRGVAPTYSAESDNRHNNGCTRWDLSMSDKYAAGRWSGWVYAYVDGDRIRSQTKYFKIS